MRKYEVMFIVHPDLEETAFKEIIERVTGWITSDGGSIDKLDVWGKRKLAYPIIKKNEGQYVLLETRMAPAFCSELEQNLGLNESIMRFLVSGMED